MGLLRPAYRCYQEEVRRVLTYLKHRLTSSGVSIYTIIMGVTPGMDKMRKLATIRRINDLLPSEGADLIVTAVIDGWTVVVKKNEFNIGDLCVYLEIDSFLPDGNPAWQHLVEKHPRMFEGNRGHRLKTVRLRGQLSQGFAAPLDKFFDAFVDSTEDEGQEPSEFFFEGNDLSSFLNIKKYEAPIPGQLAGQVRGNFPGFIPKTDQERCQNLGVDIFVTNADSHYEVTIKMDGTSFTAYHRDGETGVCGRNWELQINDDNASNTLVRMFIDSGLQTALRLFGKNYAVQGELMGPGIQKNREGLKSHKLFIFDIYDIDGGCYVSPMIRQEIFAILVGHDLNIDMIQHVPIIAHSAKLNDTLGITNVNQLLKFAEGASIHHAIREGLVFKRVDGGFSFKAISNHYLLKSDD